MMAVEPTPTATMPACENQKICPASRTPASASSPRWPTRAVSTSCTMEKLTCCTTTGQASRITERMRFDSSITPGAATTLSAASLDNGGTFHAVFVGNANHYGKPPLLPEEAPVVSESPPKLTTIPSCRASQIMTTCTAKECICAPCQDTRGDQEDTGHVRPQPPHQYPQSCRHLRDDREGRARPPPASARTYPGAPGQRLGRRDRQLQQRRP